MKTRTLLFASLFVSLGTLSQALAGTGDIGTAIPGRAKKCLNQAKLQARLFSAKDSNVAVESIESKKWFFVEETNGVYYYGILLDNGGIFESVNVGLFKKDCSLALEPNFVTNDL